MLSSSFLDLELVAYPGSLLVRPTAEEQLQGMPPGMIDRFFYVCSLTLFVLHVHNIPRARCPSEDTLG